MKLSKNSRVRHDKILLEKFGIGLNQYEEMLKQQRHRCFLCEELDSQNLAVDHDHQSGNIRGLLCSECNRILGKIKDSTEWLDRAKLYLSRTPELIPYEAPEPVCQNAKPRWRVVVHAPLGNFSSLLAAANHYDVAESTIGAWTGAYSYLRKEPSKGWSFTRIFDTYDNVRRNYNCIE